MPFESSPTISVVNDASKTLVCNVNARPTPTIKWFHNGVELSSDGVNYTIAEVSTTGSCQSSSIESTLTISNIEVDDAGSILCSASIEKSTTHYLNQSTDLVVECECFLNPSTTDVMFTSRGEDT